MTLGAHVFSLAVMLPCLAFIVWLMRRGQLRTKYLMLWLPVGGVMLVLGTAPGLLDWVSAKLGVSYPPTLLLVGAIGLLLGVCIHFSWELSRMEERMRSLVESLALDRLAAEDAARADHPEHTSATGS